MCVCVCVGGVICVCVCVYRERCTLSIGKQATFLLYVVYREASYIFVGVSEELKNLVSVWFQLYLTNLKTNSVVVVDLLIN